MSLRKKWISGGVDYCTIHDGIRNEDAHSCDFAVHDDEPGEDGGPRECVLHPLFYAEGRQG